MFNRLNRALHQALDPDGSKVQSGQVRQPTLESLEPGVREGSAARHPVLFESQGKPYRVVSTGVFDARPAGVPSYTPGAYSKAEVWRDINPTNPGDNVYFELEPTDPASGEDGENE